MAKARLDKVLLAKLAERLGKPVKYVREQIRKRAAKHQVSSEAYFVHWLGKVGLGAEIYRRSLQPDIQQEIRNLQSNQSIVPTLDGRSTRPQRIARAEKRLQIKQFKLTAKPPFLTNATINQAAKNAELYPFVFSLENAIRVLIEVVLDKTHGSHWWRFRVKKEIRDKVDKRKRTEQLNPWSAQRGAKDIYYTDFADLANILRAHTAVFEPLFNGIKGGLNFLTRRLDELEGTRNNLSHACPLKDRDRKRLQLYFEEIYDILDILHARLP